MARKSKESKIKELENRLAETQEWLEQVSKRNQEMSEQAEQGFLNSPTYHQMQQEIEFFKSLCKLNDIQLAKAKKRDLIDKEQLQQIYTDNKRMCEHEGNTEYWIGITENMHGAKEYENLRDKICELKGRVEQQERAIADRDDEIYKLQNLIGELKFQLDHAIETAGCEMQKELQESEPVTQQTYQAVAIIEHNIEHAKNIKNQRKPGRPPKVDSQKIDTVLELKAKGHSIRSIAEQLNISVGSVHRYIKMNEKNE